MKHGPFAPCSQVRLLRTAHGRLAPAIREIIFCAGRLQKMSPAHGGAHASVGSPRPKAAQARGCTPVHRAGRPARTPVRPFTEKHGRHGRPRHIRESWNPACVNPCARRSRERAMSDGGWRWARHPCLMLAFPKKKGGRTFDPGFPLPREAHASRIAMGWRPRNDSAALLRLLPDRPRPSPSGRAERRGR